jgi:hypothetical protein
MGCAGGLFELLVKGYHLIHQGDHAVVAGDIDGVGGIEGGGSGKILDFELAPCLQQRH